MILLKYVSVRKILSETRSGELEMQSYPVLQEEDKSLKVCGITNIPFTLRLSQVYLWLPCLLLVFLGRLLAGSST